MKHNNKIAITAATGQLGQLIIESLLDSVGAENIIAIVRNPEKATRLGEAGVEIRIADYGDQSAFEKALAGVDRLLLISSSEIGQRFSQHRNVAEAARKAKVSLIVYTSVLHADTSTLGLAQEHRDTEAFIKQSGLPYIFLRNGWYTENYAASIPSALQHGAFIGSAGSGRIASAGRRDYAEAAAKALLGELKPNRSYELAGDQAYSLADFAAELSRQTSRQIGYNDLPQATFRDILKSAGLPGPVAELLADSDACAAQGALFDDSGELRRIIGRPTTPFAETIAATLATAAR